MFSFVFIVGVLFVVLSVGAFISDHILPHIKPLTKFINSLPMMWDK